MLRASPCGFQYCESAGHRSIINCKPASPIKPRCGLGIRAGWSSRCGGGWTYHRTKYRLCTGLLSRESRPLGPLRGTDGPLDSGGDGGCGRVDASIVFHVIPSHRCCSTSQPGSGNISHRQLARLVPRRPTAHNICQKPPTSPSSHHPPPTPPRRPPPNPERNRLPGSWTWMPHLLAYTTPPCIIVPLSVRHLVYEPVR